jgi:hypothetical protein
MPKKSQAIQKDNNPLLTASEIKEPCTLEEIRNKPLSTIYSNKLQAH